MINTKRRGLVFGFIFVFIICFLISEVSASIGVRPATYDVDFKPNLKETYTFNFFQDTPNELTVYAEGDLAEYVKLSTNKIERSNGGTVDATLILPKDIEVPGVHRILIGAKQKVENKAGFALVGNIQAVIKVKVPYPGQYLEISLETTNANAGQNVDFTLHIVNLGKETVVANGRIEIYDKYGNELIEAIPFDSKSLEPTGSEDLYHSLNTKNYKPGDYKVVAVVNYGDSKSARKEAIFRLGEMRVDIINYTSVFKKDTLNRMEIRTESFWNDPIDNLYATVQFLGTDAYLQTPSTTIKGFDKTMLTGFFDTVDIKEEPFSANITIHYNNKTSSRVVNDLTFKKESNHMLLYVAIAVAVLAIVIGVVIYLIMRRRNGKKNK